MRQAYLQMEVCYLGALLRAANGRASGRDVSMRLLRGAVVSRGHLAARQDAMFPCGCCGARVIRAAIGRASGRDVPMRLLRGANDIFGLSFWKRGLAMVH